MRQQITKTLRTVRRLTPDEKYSLASASSTTPPTNASNPAPTTPNNTTSDTVTFKSIHPNTRYRESMRELRKQYMLEWKEKKQSEEEAEKRRQESERAKQEALKADIARYKFQHSRSVFDGASSGSGAVEVSPTTPSRRSAVKESGKMEDDPLVAERRKMWTQWVKERRQLRFESHLNAAREQREEKLEKLLYLFHASGDFVTYDNIDDKISQVLVGFSSRPANMSQFLGNQIKKENARVAAREKILREALEGTIAGGEIGTSGVRSWVGRSGDGSPTNMSDKPSADEIESFQKETADGLKTVFAKLKDNPTA
ncbi:hypothetical protein HK102_004152 [Quaeritorhiza haematococci]|nr:hypothetical protein HK102_004152 [Quaeritorhiza haematococci]